MLRADLGMLRNAGISGFPIPDFLVIFSAGGAVVPIDIYAASVVPKEELPSRRVSRSPFYLTTPQYDLPS